MRPLVSAAEMRAAEEHAIRAGDTAAGMMQRAGGGAASILLGKFGTAARYLVLAGPGNNGGDALVVARCLRDAGAEVTVFTINRSASPPVNLTDLQVRALGRDDDLEALKYDLTTTDVIVDGVLGTGKSRPLQDNMAMVLRTVRMAAVKASRVALDIPTGASADTGEVDENAFQADATLTFGYVKLGLRLYPAKSQCGTVHVIDIGLPHVPSVGVDVWEPEPSDVAQWLPAREDVGNKFTVGAVLALSGSPHFVGAPILCTSAALRSGAGYVTLAAREAVVQSLSTRLLETTMLTLSADPFEALTQIRGAASKYSSMLVGPGLGREPNVVALVIDVLCKPVEGPRGCVVDADALFALSTRNRWWEAVRMPLVLTPHSGEMSRLTGISAEAIDANRVAVAARFAREWQQVVVLKGAPTVVASPDGAVCLNSTGNVLLATAGSGDVLSGIIAALIAGGAAPSDAARAGVFVHGMAADLAIPRFGDRGMIAGDLLDLIPHAIRDILHPVQAANGYSAPGKFIGEGNERPC